MMIMKRVPANVIAKRNVKRYQRGPPPTAMPVIPAARTPRPVVVVIDPAAIMIRSPAPRLIPNPGPAIR